MSEPEVMALESTTLEGLRILFIGDGLKHNHYGMYNYAFQTSKVSTSRHSSSKHRTSILPPTTEHRVLWRATSTLVRSFHFFTAAHSRCCHLRGTLDLGFLISHVSCRARAEHCLVLLSMCSLYWFRERYM